MSAGVPGGIVVRGRGAGILRIQKVDVRAHGDDLPASERPELAIDLGVSAERWQCLVPKRRVVEIQTGIDDRDLETVSQQPGSSRANSRHVDVHDVRDVLEHRFVALAGNHARNFRKRSDGLRLRGGRSHEDRVQHAVRRPHDLNVHRTQRIHYGALRAEDRPAQERKAARVPARQDRLRLGRLLSKPVAHRGRLQEHRVRSSGRIVLGFLRRPDTDEREQGKKRGQRRSLTTQQVRNAPQGAIP